MRRNFWRAVRGGVLKPAQTNRINFLHIGKNAGTEINRWMGALNSSQQKFIFEKHSHATLLRDLPRRELYFFSIRDPIARFKSGFYSRQRKGQPRLYMEWSRHERLSFETFPHANDLAEALFSAGPRGEAALEAMLSIFHVNSYQIDWFKGRGHFLKEQPPVWVIRQSHLESDMKSMLDILEIEAPPLQNASDETSHSFDYAEVPSLSPLAEKNLRRWFAVDFQFIEMCESWMTRA